MRQQVHDALPYISLGYREGCIMPDQENSADGLRLAGGVLVLCGLASFGLLALHPGGDARDFAGVLNEEAANQALNAVVHGGFIAVLAVEMVCYAVFAARLKRMAGLAGIVLFAMGTAFLCGSLLTDGLVIPALAAKYLAAPNKLDFARSLFVLCETFIRFLMPIGLGLQAAGVTAWGWALLRGGKARLPGLVGLLAGGAIVASLGATLGLNPLVLMGAFAALATWPLVAGTLMLRKAV